MELLVARYLIGDDSVLGRREREEVNQRLRDAIGSASADATREDLDDIAADVYCEWEQDMQDEDMRGGG